MSDIDEELTTIFDNGSVVKTIEWSDEHEGILIEWADKAMCFKWLHSKAHEYYSSLNTMYTIPVIVISTLTGTANFAQERVPIQYQNLFVMTVGGFNILAGIISTIQQFLKISQLNESHRVGGIAWDKFYRNIKIELAKHPHERKDVTKFIDFCKEEFDRLMETSPSIPEKIINEFKKTFKDSNTYGKIILPEICADTFKNPWYDESKNEKRNLESANLQQMKEIKLKKTNENNNQIVNDFITSFTSLNNREPMESEIYDNLKDKMNIKTLEKIIEKNKTNQKPKANTDSQNVVINISGDPNV
uniref:SMODS and SLOG-associating 2TM effector domain-containing protein n=1 Tax=viral metagenome TaxID=1070528 RepID=A0A6C0IGQ6_9ZZZZ